MICLLSHKWPQNKPYNVVKSCSSLLPTCRFAKNLSPDKINLSTLKGEGQLTNLELDEEVLQSMLDLPTWLAINKVGCNKAAIRIPWTKLKTHPISLTLDKVVMEMSTCDEPRPPNGPSPIATASGQSEYGFAEKVVEGISLSINSIVVKISAKAFNASFELSQLQVYSVNTSWVLSDLRFTRIHDPHRGEILTFKEISWQMIRIEADAIQSAEHEILSAPIRLITNQSKIRVTLKRRAKDCNVVASKLVLILDDLLWVLTDSQLKAMVQYAKSLSEAMDKSAQQRKSMATEDQDSSVPPTAQQVRAQQASSGSDQSVTMAKLFTAYDVCETSHHLQITHLDLHICDDIHAKDRVNNKRMTGGAMQLSFSLITLDYYPFHRAGDSCLHWMHYSEATKAREVWVKSLLEEFKSNVEMLKTVKRDRQGLVNTHTSPQHGKHTHLAGTRKISTGSTSVLIPPQTPKSQLMSSSFILRVADFSIYQVSTADQRRSSPKAMISCNKKSLYLPPEMPAVHIEFTEYYFPDGKDYPVPCPNLYVQQNALQLVLDPRSLVWCNLFALDLRQSLEQFMELYKLNAEEQKPEEHMDVRVDGLMLKVGVREVDLPRSISVQCSEMVATNTRQPSNCTRSHLEALLLSFQEEQFFAASCSSFPRSSASFPLIHPIFQRHAHEQDTVLQDVYKGLVAPSLGVDALKMAAATDLWALHFAQFWVDYEGTRGGKGRPQPFVDAFPLTAWVCQPARHAQHQERLRCGAPGGPLSRSGSVDVAGHLQRKRLLKEYYSTAVSDKDTGATLPPSNGLHEPLSLDNIPASSTPSRKEADMHVLVHVQKHLSVSHRQYIFLMRLQRSLKALQHTLQQDLEEMGSKRDKTKVTSEPAPDHQPFTACVGFLLRSAEVALLLKPVPQPEGPGSPLGSELSPSESRANLEAGCDGGEGGNRGTPVEEAGAKGGCMVDHGLDVPIVGLCVLLCAQVSVLVLKVQCVCGAMEVCGESTAVALEVGRIRPTQLGNVSLRQYLSNHSLGRGLETSADGTPHNPEVRARLESGPCAAAHSPLAETNGFLQLRVHGYRASFLMSSLRNLAHFLEDDSAPQVLPMEISVRDTHIDLKDDGPRDNLSDPEPSPITLHISNLLIHRTDDGAFSIGGETLSRTHAFNGSHTCSFLWRESRKSRWVGFAKLAYQPQNWKVVKAQH
uniref:Chorein N-terminal domain-containing protein n=1 Tax=Esox lucius TaxID=8010 RepID=A0A6Q2XRJ3_ESOLU